MSQEYILSIYNPTTGRSEEIAVTETVFHEYRRGGWAIENSDKRFHKHETAFSDLKGGLV